MKHHLTNARARVGAETTAQLVRILAPRLTEPEVTPEAGDWTYPWTSFVTNPSSQVLSIPSPSAHW